MGQLGSAAVNWVADQDYPIFSNSFIMPVRKGETWQVWFDCTWTGQSIPNNIAQPYLIYWIPLGQ